MKFNVDDWVAYDDDDLGRQIGQVVRRIKANDPTTVWCIGGLRSSLRDNPVASDHEVTYQVRWKCQYPPDLPGSVHESRLKKLSPLEELAAQA